METTPHNQDVYRKDQFAFTRVLKASGALATEAQIGGESEAFEDLVTSCGD